MSEIQIFDNVGNVYQTHSFRFPGGELDVKIDSLESLSGPVSILARIQSSDDILKLTMLYDEILRYQNSISGKILILPYIPYARQDRVTEEGQVFTLKWFCNLINSMNFNEVVVCDPHSDVAIALLNNVKVVDQLTLVKANIDLYNLLMEDDVVIVAPDAGAVKKCNKVAQYFKRPLVQASKNRDVETGKITGVSICNSWGSIRDRKMVIVDDLIDGGATFIELAKALRSQGAEKVFLSVTHGLFSKGTAVLDGLIDKVYCTDSFVSPYVDMYNNDMIFVNNLEFDYLGVTL